MTMTDDEHSLFPPEPPEPVAQASEPAPVEFNAQPGPPLPEDIRVPWGWGDVLLLVPVSVGGLFFFVILIIVGFALMRVPIESMRQSPSQLGIISVVAQVLLDLALLGYMALQLRLRFHSPFWRTIGWRPLETGQTPHGAVYLFLVLGGFLLAVVVAWADSLFPPKNELPIQTILQGHTTVLLFMLTAVLVAPLVEETVFRGFLYPVAARSFGVGAGIVITGTLFGLLHGIQLWGGWWQIGLLVVVGIVFTLVRARARTVVASFVLHTSYNSLQVIALLIGTHGLRHFPGAH